MRYLESNRVIFVIIFIVSVIFFMQGLSIHGIEYRDDEIFYFNSTKEMVETGNLMSPVYFGENRFQKPILFYWMIIFFYKILGISWLAARLPSVVTASLTMALTYILAKEFFNKRIAVLSAIILSTLPMFFRHAKNAVPDMTLNFFIVLAVYFLFKFFKDSKKKIYSYLFFIACALGFMIKGFAAIIVPFIILIAYAIARKQTYILAKINFPAGILIILIIVLPWFIYMTSIHGESYMQYMLGVETLNRTVSQGQGNIIVKVLTTFRNNSLFYLQTIMSYFAPWSVFVILAIPLAIRDIGKETEKKESLLAMLVWFVAVFVFFSLIFHRINHLILVLTTPFAILISYFFLEVFDASYLRGKIIMGFRKYMSLFIFTSGLIGFSFVKVFLLGGGKVWLLALLAVLILGYFIVARYKDPIAVPLVVGVFLLFCFSQTMLLSKARLTALSAMQEFSYTINRQLKEPGAIGVGSHDIHEKEFQIYFNKEIEKVATSDYSETETMLAEFFDRPGEAYCLITQRDYNTFLKDSSVVRMRVIQEDFMFRRRINIDKEFFVSILKLDQQKIKDYFLEKVILVKKESHG